LIFFSHFQRNSVWPKKTSFGCLARQWTICVPLASMDWSRRAGQGAQTHRSPDIPETIHSK